ncbi:hypothetical protein TNCV_2979541 [Trichonephila clavipes]|nr:hypothetical protein TNCV_2979541 [Trichonephila clavipes]
MKWRSPASSRWKKSQYRQTVPGEKGEGCNGTIHHLARSQSSRVLIPTTQTRLKRNKFDNIPEIQRNVTRLLNYIPKEDFLQSFQNMCSRSQRFIAMGGDYFEGQ